MTLTGDDAQYAEPGAYAVRYGSKVKPVGSKIEYGFCARNVPVAAS